MKGARPAERIAAIVRSRSPGGMPSHAIVSRPPVEGRRRLALVSLAGSALIVATYLAYTGGERRAVARHVEAHHDRGRRYARQAESHEGPAIGLSLARPWAKASAWST